MSVYVDDAVWPYGRMKMCHMIADTPQELIDMVRALGLNLKWFQHQASAPHFDVSKGKRAVAVALGALPLDRRGFMDVVHRIRETWPRDERGCWVLLNTRHAQPRGVQKP